MISFDVKMLTTAFWWTFTVPFLTVRTDFTPKRNQARQKLATLQIGRFMELASEVFFELERRYPQLVEEFDAKYGVCVASGTHTVPQMFLSDNLLNLTSPSSPVNNSNNKNASPVSVPTPFDNAPWPVHNPVIAALHQKKTSFPLNAFNLTMQHLCESPGPFHPRRMTGSEAGRRIG